MQLCVVSVARLADVAGWVVDGVCGDERDARGGRVGVRLREHDADGGG